MPQKKHQGEFDRLIAQNVEAISRIEQAEHEMRTGADRVADAVAGMAGTMVFVWANALFFAAWLAWNLVGPEDKRFDPVPFSNLTLLVSLEAIFLSIFILISQNRQRRAFEKRHHLDLQINLLAEQESSLMLEMLRDLMVHEGMTISDDRIAALEIATEPEQVAEHIEQGAQALQHPDVPEQKEGKD